MAATAKSVEGESSGAPARTAASNASAESLSPGSTSQKRSVLAVHSTTTRCTPLRARKARMSARSCSSCSCFDPDRTRQQADERCRRNREPTLTFPALPRGRNKRTWGKGPTVAALLPDLPGVWTPDRRPCKASHDRPRGQADPRAKINSGHAGKYKLTVVLS
ncbi:Protein of unknown function [Gryllus bimaculatus]|nr:Protein of unknown function [Gryllus bimaculatus]